MSTGFGNGLIEILSNVMTFVERMISVMYIGSASTGLPCNKMNCAICLFNLFVAEPMSPSVISALPAMSPHGDLNTT